jgi:penicillin-insensitive murein endopeptidase
MRRLPLASIGLALLCVAGAASATPAGGRGGQRWPQARELPRHSRSIGLPWEGRLERAVRVRQSPYIDYVDEYIDDGHFWGTWELVQLVERAAWYVHRRLPGARLSVGDLSKRRGGPIAGHHSHEAGRDVDLAFYMRGPGGTVHEPKTFVGFGRRGRGLAPNGHLRFDDARNWVLISKLVTDGDARVQYIFVSDAIEARLLRYARARGAPRRVVRRARKVMVEPSHGHPHRNHFHVRIYCSPGDRPACKDEGPLHAWYPGDPPPFAALRPGGR